MSVTIATCGGCKQDAVEIQTGSVKAPGHTPGILRRAVCKACGRVGPWKAVQAYQGISNEAQNLVHVSAPQGASK